MTLARQAVLLAAVLTVPAFGCGPAEIQGGRAFEVDTLEDGSVLVENNGAGAWDPGAAWIAVEDLRIGAVEGGGPEQFGIISGLAVDSEGKIFVAEAQAVEVRVFLPNGNYLQTLGRNGEGPGEFRVPYGLKLDSSENLWIRDVRMMRYSEYSSEGGFIRSFPIRIRGRMPNWEAGVDAEGRLIDWSVRLPYVIERDGSGRANPLARSSDEIEYIPIRHTQDGQIQDSLHSIWHKLDLISGTWVLRPYSGELLLDLSPDLRVWTADSREYKVARRTLGAEKADLVFGLPFVAERVNAEERLAAVRRGVGGHGISEAEVPDTKPVLLGLTADEDGHILVFPQGEGMNGGEVVDVFLDSGVFLGRVPLPLRLEMRPEPVMRDGHLYGVAKDSVDVPYVVRIRMAPPMVG